MKMIGYIGNGNYEITFLLKHYTIYVRNRIVITEGMPTPNLAYSLVVRALFIDLNQRKHLKLSLLHPGQVL